MVACRMHVAFRNHLFYITGIMKPCIELGLHGNTFTWKQIEAICTQHTWSWLWNCIFQHCLCKKIDDCTLDRTWYIVLHLRFGLLYDFYMVPFHMMNSQLRIRGSFQNSNLLLHFIVVSTYLVPRVHNKNTKGIFIMNSCLYIHLYYT